jgi:formate/nitrite transporter FocA (FNT family)
MTHIRDFFRKPARKVDDISNYPKSAEEIFHEQVQTGLAEHNRSPGGLLVSAIAAGLEVGFTLFLAGIVLTLFYDKLDSPALHIWLALAYPIGFIFVVIGRSELFTEHTTLAVIPVLNGSTNFLSLMKTWGLVFTGNLIGGYLMAFILTQIGPPMEIISIDSFNYLANKMVEVPWNLMLGSSIIAGWLMGLLSWLVTSSQETISRIVMVILVTFLIGMGGLHHSIVGSIEVFAGVLTAGISANDYLHFQWWTTLGNIIGGVVFVSLIKFSTIRLSEQDRERNSD